VLPEVLADVLASYADGAYPGRTPALTVIVDETTVTDQVHVLVAGLAYQGIALPLAVRTWVQNTRLPRGEYWSQVHAVLRDVQAVLPAVLRDHVVLVADRGFAVARLVDLGWCASAVARRCVPPASPLTPARPASPSVRWRRTPTGQRPPRTRW
jgi:hypothetical protein